MRITNDWQSIPFENIIELYNEVGWTAYTKEPENLHKAFLHSSLVLIAQENAEIIGVLRSLSDFTAVHYLQDILVSPTHQKKGIGTRLLSEALEYFKDVRTHILLTDDEEKQALFYQSLGYKNIKDLQKHLLNVFIQMKNINLE